MFLTRIKYAVFIVGLTSCFFFFGIQRPSSTANAQSIDTNWSSDGSRFWYQKPGEGHRSEFLVVEATERKIAPAFSKERVLPKLAQLLDVDVQAVHITRIEFVDPDDSDRATNQIYLAANGKYFLLDREAHEVSVVERPEGMTSAMPLFMPPSRH